VIFPSSSVNKYAYYHSSNTWCSKYTYKDAGRDHIPRDEPLLYTIQPRTSTPYAWDYPAAKDKKIQLIINSSKRVVDIMEIGDLVPFKFPVIWYNFKATETS